MVEGLVPLDGDGFDPVGFGGVEFGRYMVAAGAVLGRDPLAAGRALALVQDLSGDRPSAPLGAVAAIAGVGRDGAARSAEIWRSSARNHAANLMHRPVDKITTGDVLACITPLGSTAHDTAKKVRQRRSLAFRWAMAVGHRPDDPAGEALLAALPRNGRARRHMAALPPDKAPTALAATDNSAAYPTTKLTMRMLALTATRSGEARGMCWDEIDGDIWTIPGERTNVGREFRVPLSPEALAVLDEARRYSDGTPDSLVFPSARGGQITPDALSKLCHELDLGMTPFTLLSGSGVAVSGLVARRGG